MQKKYKKHIADHMKETILKSLDEFILIFKYTWLNFLTHVSLFAYMSGNPAIQISYKSVRDLTDYHII
jgi:hypothetical protein